MANFHFQVVGTFVNSSLNWHDIKLKIGVLESHLNSEDNENLVWMKIPIFALGRINLWYCGMHVPRISRAYTIGILCIVGIIYDEMIDMFLHDWDSEVSPCEVDSFHCFCWLYKHVYGTFNIEWYDNVIQSSFRHKLKLWWIMSKRCLTSWMITSRPGILVAPCFDKKLSW